MQTLFHDLRYAFRQLRRAPGFALAAILTLALGIGATTTMLAVVDSVLLRPVSLPHADRVVSLERVVRGQVADNFAFKDLDALATVKSFDAVGGYGSFPTPVATAAGTKIHQVLSTSAAFFRVAGQAPRMGRLLRPEDAGRPLAVVNDGFWREALHADPLVIGSTVKVGARLLTIVGVLAPEFSFPQYFKGPALYVPATVDAKGKDEHGLDSTSIVARLKPGVTTAAALAEAKSVYAHAPLTPGHEAGHENDRGDLLLTLYSKTITGDEQPALLALLGACGLLLLIACANSANLQIARGATRTGEMHVRAALGASRSRLLQQIVTESLTLSLLGAALGLVFAQLAVTAARHAYAKQFARFDELTLHPAAYLACTLIAIAAGVLAALAPAITTMRRAGTLNASQPTRVTGSTRLSGLLVAAEIALTCVLLTTAGLFLRTFRALEQVPLGFDPHHVTEISLMPLNPNEDLNAVKQTYDRLLDRLGTMPGIEAAMTETSLPFSNFDLAMTGSLHRAGQPKQRHDSIDITLVNDSYFRTMGVPLLRGRNFTPADSASAPVVAIANEAAARRFLGGTRVVGEQVEFGNDATDGTDTRFIKTPITIIGVIRDQVTKSDIGKRATPLLLLNYKQYPAANNGARFLMGIAPQFAARSTLPQSTLEREIRTALKDAAPDMAEMKIATIDDGIDQVLATRRLALRLASGFGAIALLLAGVGIYSVLAFAVTARTREIGIRMALGSSRQGAMRLVLRQAAVMVAAGLAAGIAAAWPADRAVRSFLYGVRAMDPLTLASVALLLLAVCTVAAATPAYRATQVDPIEALRAE